MKTELISRSTLKVAWDKERDIDGLLTAVENAFLSFGKGEVILPSKSSQIFDEATQDRINCMPATVLPLGLSGVKWVSVFPENPSKRSIPNVGGLMVLSEIKSGCPVCVMDASYLTALRTAAVDALAARLFAPLGARVLTILGTGEQARFHAELMSLALTDISEIRISGRTAAHAATLVSDLSYLGCSVVDYGNDMQAACDGADIVITCISGQAPILKADWLDTAKLYCHVGGWEDEYEVPRKANKIICDYWDALKHRGSPTIARMYSEGLLSDSDIHADITEVLCDVKSGRVGDELIYFNAIGLGFIDVAVAAWLMDRARSVPSFDFHE